MQEMVRGDTNEAGGSCGPEPVEAQAPNSRLAIALVAISFAKRFVGIGTPCLRLISTRSQGFRPDTAQGTFASSPPAIAKKGEHTVILERIFRISGGFLRGNPLMGQSKP